ncbi:hypothetical protein F4604DRAFT_1682439 [Suillus subluteus]|nr:hypothetical protein F4604DRAFT_1682439 [Suillus subluteus]
MNAIGGHNDTYTGKDPGEDKIRFCFCFPFFIVYQTHLQPILDNTTSIWYPNTSRATVRQSEPVYQVFRDERTGKLSGGCVVGSEDVKGCGTKKIQPPATRSHTYVGDREEDL